MAWTVAAFMDRYPEYRQAGEGLVQRAISEARTQVDPSVYGNKTDLAVGLIAAISLASSPYARTNRLDSDGQTAEYETRLAEVKKQVRVPFTVL